MSVKSELTDLLDKADRVLRDAEGVAGSERSRIGDLFAAVRGALVSFVEPAEKPAAEKPRAAKASKK